MTLKLCCWVLRANELLSSCFIRKWFVRNLAMAKLEERKIKIKSDQAAQNRRSITIRFKIEALMQSRIV